MGMDENFPIIPEKHDFNALAKIKWSFHDLIHFQDGWRLIFLPQKFSSIHSP